MSFLSFALFLLSQVTICQADFGNIGDELKATNSFLQHFAEVRKALDATPDIGVRRAEASIAHDKHDFRQLKADKKKGKKAAAAQCKADLAEAEVLIQEMQAELAKPSMLGIQTAPTCRIERGSRPGQYKLISDTIGDDTYIFSDRPYTIEYTMKTEDFIEDFDTIFEEARPNTGLTFVSDSGEDVGPFVVVFESASIDGGTITYDIDQSDDQNNVLSIESIFNGSDSVSYEHCSYFIDNWFTKRFTCKPCKKLIPKLVKYSSKAACIVGCEAAVVPLFALVLPFEPVAIAACPVICWLVIREVGGASADYICDAAGLC